MVVDKLIDEGNVELDYSQIFKIRKQGSKIIIEQNQEVPEYKVTYLIELEDVELNEEIKVYIIDSGDYSTMLFSSEY